MMDVRMQRPSRARLYVMNTDGPHPLALETIQPIVLVGGRSRRFGRDKLREPWGETGLILVQHPIEILRKVFGPRVMLVGKCDADILPLADGMIPDEHPGVGPMGGIVSALRFARQDIFVLAGDMPHCNPHLIWTILSAAARQPSLHAMLAKSDRIHPCVGLYRPAALSWLEPALARGEYSLQACLTSAPVGTVPTEPEALTNINRPEDLHLLSVSDVRGSAMEKTSTGPD